MNVVKYDEPLTKYVLILWNVKTIIEETLRYKILF